MHALEGIKSWSEFTKIASSVSEKERGDMFEVLTKHYLLLDPVRSTLLTDVWLWSEIPPSIKEKLHLEGRDMGIDLVAQTKTGTYWAIQCKYRSDTKGSLPWSEISTFVGLSLIRDRFEYCLIAYTGEKYSSVLKQAEEGKIGFLSSDTWEELDDIFFSELETRIKGARPQIELRRPRPHQQRAIENAKKYYVDAGKARGKLIMPCGAGKSLTAFWIAEALEAKTIVLAVPSLALIQQTLPDWLREYSARGETEKLRWLCVCSDKSVAHDIDSLAVHTHDLGFPCSTDVEDVREWLRSTADASMRIIFTTYQSGEILSAAFRAEGLQADLGIMDEAHKTVGQRGGLFTHLLFDENIPIKRRLFMTATERRFAGKDDEIASMDDETIYGEVFEQLSFKKALEEGILSDYRIITRIVSSEEVEERVKKNTLLHLEQEKVHDIEAQMLASAVSLVKSSQRLPIRHSVSFHSSVARARKFKDLFSDIYKHIEPTAETTETFHVSGKTAAAERKGTIKEFANAPRALITNARCLTEGVDVPSIDCVLFADPRKSKVDIVQAVGRALRRAKDKEFGYVLIPVISHGEPPNVFVESEAFQAVIEVIRALAANDERIIDYFEAKREGRKFESGKELIEIHADELVVEKFDIGEFEEHIGIKVWKKITPLTRRYLPYDEATKFVHELKLSGFREWWKYVKGKMPNLPPLPEDIPSSAYNIYGQEFLDKGGWAGWVGTGYKRKLDYLNYPEARAYVHSLKLSGTKAWWEYKKTGKLPTNIPKQPDRVYGKEYVDGGRMPGWLGIEKKSSRWKNRTPNKLRKNKWRPYDEAVKFTRSLGLRNTNEWRDYCAGRMPWLPPKPPDIPGSRESAYPEYYERGGDGSWIASRPWRKKNPDWKPD